MKRLFLIVFLLFFLNLTAQDWKIPKVGNGGWEVEQEFTLNKRRRNILLISEASAYTVALVGLNQLWYADYPKSSFHFINDNKEWLQMDKMGHMSASYYTGVAGIKAYEWAGFSRKNAIWYGGMTGSIFLTVIEALDGTSEQWGASSGDLIANTTGSLLAIGQALKWNEQRIQLKYSYRPSNMAAKNPEQLGSNHLERALKDYNGQTYWMSFNLKSLLQVESESFPNWLSLSLGYGAHCMKNPYPKEGKPVWRKRQYLLSFDVDLNRIKTKNKTLNSVLHTFGFLKFPAPALQYRNGNIFFHPIYY
ncbi:MAG: DUF2279 domain-containing protein [Flavobacteriales bacterium]|nr:DUF2279 domain-containing protein [Flavobacteriales bacterium]